MAASLAYGLAVGARPSLLFGAAILGVPVVLAWRERIAANSRTPPWSLMAAAVIPLTMCGLGLMLYNDLRFGDPLEFGQRHQLQGERVDASMIFFSPRYLWFNLRVYFLEPVRWSRFFPYFGDIPRLTPPPGHAKFESGAGVLTNIPILLLSLAAPLAWSGRSQPVRTTLRGFVTSATLLFAACALVLCLFLGNCWRYEVEFLPALALLAAIGLFGLERALVNRRPLRVAARAGWSILLAYSIAFNLAASVNARAEQMEDFAQRLMGAGKVDEATALYRRVFQLRADFPEAHYNLGRIWAQLPGRSGDAIAEYQAALRLRPDYAEVHNRLGLAWSQQPGHLPDAIAEYQAALRSKPDLADAHYHLGDAWMSLPGHLPNAIAEYESALRLKPVLAEAHNNLGNAYSITPGRTQDAIAHYEEALRSKPDYADAHFNLALVLLKIPGRAEEARSHLQAVLRLQPETGNAKKLLAGIPAPRP